MTVKHILCVFLLITIIGTACESLSQKSQKKYQKPLINEVGMEAGNFSITWTLLYDTDGEDRFRYAIKLKNEGRVPLKGQTWALYFNFGHGILTKSASPNVVITHVNGDFYRITPSGLFESLNPGEMMLISFESGNLAFKESDAPAGFYFVFNEGHESQSPPHSITDFRIEPDITAKQTVRGERDHVPVPTPVSRYLDNQVLTELPSDKIIPVVPGPVWYEKGTGEWLLDSTVVVHYESSLESEAIYLVDALEQRSGIRVRMTTDAKRIEKTISLRVAEVSVGGVPRGDGDEAYHLNVNSSNGIEITGSDRAGLFYGIQSLLALTPEKALRNHPNIMDLAEIEVEDAPRFPYRGFMLDVSRNFQSKESVLKLLDLMASYKLNKFHLHLADDEGWRLEIKHLPELTNVGGRRGHPVDELDWLIPSFGSGPNPPESKGYYSRSDFIEILKFAHTRHIEVITEIDLPGHARAAVKSMESRYHRLVEGRQSEDASSYRLVDPLDKSVYRSVQGWNDNVINVCQPSTYEFIETVIDDIDAIYDEAGVPLRMIHVGGDEVPEGVWAESPACERLIESEEHLSGVWDLAEYFRRRIIDILKERQLLAAGWQELALHEIILDDKKAMEPNKGLAESVVPYYWFNVWGWGSEDIGYRLANAGFKVVMSCATNLYLDLAYNKHPEEPGLIWAGFVDTRKVYEFVPLDIYRSAGLDRTGNPVDIDEYQNSARLTPDGKRNILGIQGQLWGERLTSVDRLEYMAFPKLIALAERAWASQPAWATIDDSRLRKEMLSDDWNAFANCLGQRELARLDNFRGGVAYRIPPPGAIIEEGLLKANVKFPGMTIRYTTDGNEPTVNSLRYSSPISVKGVVKLKTFDSRGRSSRTSTISSL